MKRKKIKLMVLVLVLGTSVALILTSRNMLLFKSNDFKVNYTVNDTAYQNGSVLSKWGDRENYYLHLPSFPAHTWWRFQPETKLLQSINHPKKFLAWWMVSGVPLGVGIDFEVKIGHWDYSFNDTGMEFQNTDLVCSVEFPQ